MAFISAPEPSLHWGPPSLRISHRSISWYSKPGLGLAFLVSLSDIYRYCTNLFQVANFASCCSTRGLGHRRLPPNSCFERAKTRKIWSNVWQIGRNGHLIYSIATFHIRCSHTIDHSIRTNLGLRLSRPSWMLAPFSAWHRKRI